MITRPLLVFTNFYIVQKKGSLAEVISVLSNSKNGDFYVVQVGANDGITNDPIHKFIKRDRWKGVLLEPQPTVFHHFLKRIYKNHEGLHVICAAIGHEDGHQKLYKIGFSEMRWATGLASFSKKKIEDLFENGIVDKNCQKLGISIPESPEERISYELVDVISPDTLVRKYEISHIDLLQIDTEGFDLEVIEIFDIPKTKPGTIIFENESLAPDVLNNCYQKLQDQGYRLKEFGRDTLAMLHPPTQFAKYFD